MQFVAHYPDLLHHPREEVLFRHLRSHAPDLADAINYTTREHREMSRIASEISGLIFSVNAGEVIDKALLVERIRDYVSLSRKHMQREERVLFFPSLKLLDEDVWDRLIDEFNQEHPASASSAKLDAQYRALYREGVGAV